MMWRKAHRTNNNKKNNNDRKNSCQRRRLEQYLGQQIEFTAQFTCFSRTTSSAHKMQTTMLLKNIQLSDGRFICQHIWVKVDEFIKKDVPVSLQAGQKVRLVGIPYTYYCDWSGGMSVKYSIGNLCLLEQTDGEQRVA